jgi:HTH-type transcriptional repressor of NAD biosynthesis genes
MSKGLIIGKFMPFHRGHIALIDFAATHCDRLTVLVSARNDEPIPGPERLKWVKQTFRAREKIHIEYTEEKLPDAPVSSRPVSRIWADFLSHRFPAVDILFSSEPYGEFLAEYMGITHVMFDLPRTRCPVSGSAIRREPLKHWKWIPQAVRPWFTKKICIYGPESTGKSTLTEQLASHFKGGWVPEGARDVLAERSVDNLVFDDIAKIALFHARTILEEQEKGYRYLFCDTDLITTRIYSNFYFQKVPVFPPWVEAANTFDHYIFCDTDVPWVEDRHRNLGHMRVEMRRTFEEELAQRHISFSLLSGPWSSRFQHAVEIIEALK